MSFPQNVLNKRPDLPLTPHKMLSFVTSFFDTLGLIALVLLQAKILLQDLCNRECDWDEMSKEYLDRWAQWVNSLKHLKGLSIARCYKDPALIDVHEVHLQHCADATSQGIWHSFLSPFHRHEPKRPLCSYYG